MNVNEYIIDQIKSRYGEQCLIEPVLYEVSTAAFEINSKNDILVLANQILDIPITAKLTMNSDDNTLITSKTEFEEWKEYRNQRFIKNITIILENYALPFIPFQLEFMKVTPVPKKEECNQ